MKGFLNPRQRQDLVNKHRGTPERRQADRIKSILMADEGYTAREIARILLLDEDTIGKNLDRYQTGGIALLLEWNYHGYDGKLTESQEAEVKEYVQEHLVRESKEVVAWIRKRFGIEYAESGMIHLLNRLGFVYKKTKLVPAKADGDAQQSFVKGYRVLKKAMGSEDKIYFMDGVHAVHNAMPAYAWVERGMEKMLKSNTGRERINFNGALDSETHEVIIREDERINAQSTRCLLEEIEAKNPKAKRIVVIADNARYYRNRHVTEFLTKSKVEILFLPPYAPNLNLIERLWKLFKKIVIRGEYYEKFAEFRRSAWAFFKNIQRYKSEMETLLTENFQIIDSG
jgi:transposase